MVLQFTTNCKTIVAYQQLGCRQKVDYFVGYPYDPDAMVGINQTYDLKYTFLTPVDYENSPNYKASYRIFPNSIRWTASWSGKQYEGFMSSWRYNYYELGANNEPIQPGDYYTEFVVNLTSHVRKTVRVDFTVTE